MMHGASLLTLQSTPRSTIRLEQQEDCQPGRDGEYLFVRPASVVGATAQFSEPSHLRSYTPPKSNSVILTVDV